MMLIASRRVENAWLALEQRGAPSVEMLTADIYDSWMRCISLGLDTRRAPEPEFVSPATLRQEQQRCSLVRGLALAEMHTLHQQISGSNFMIALANADGLLLDIISDQSFNDASDAVSIRPGAVWKETFCGTNALGTAAHLKRAIAVHGGQHFFPRYNNLTCVAAPIFAPDGELTGILDASSDCLSRQTHTQALVAMAATQIENGLFREYHRGDILIAFHNRGEYLHTLSAGLLAVDDDGKILAANRAARAFCCTACRPRRADGSSTCFGRNSAHLSTRADARSVKVLKTRSAANSFQRSRTRGSFRWSRRLPLRGRQPTAEADRPRNLYPPIRTIAEIVRQSRDRGGAQDANPHSRRDRHRQGATGASRACGQPTIGPFVAVNCAALPESLIEAELFGYTEGAFTGARKGGSAGLFKEADGGTLFLDEIGDMPVALQAVLLRFLDDWTVRPVGGAKRQIDVLLVSATNANLDQLIAKVRFRSDLLFRLNTLEVTVAAFARTFGLCRYRTSSAETDRPLRRTYAKCDRPAGRTRLGRQYPGIA